jgi:hypothetical protein
MVQYTNMQTNLQGNEQFFSKKFAKEIWVVLTTTTNTNWIKYFVVVGIIAITMVIMFFDFAFFKQFAKNYLPFKNDVVLWLIAAFCCFYIVVFLKLVFSEILALWIEQHNDYQGNKSYGLKFFGLFVLFIGLLAVALYGSHNGYIVIVKENIVFAKLPENTDLQAAKDSLAASQKYYNTMIVKEQGELEEAKINLEKDNWNPSYHALVKAATKQKEVLLSAKLEQAKFWQNRINKIENRFYDEVQQVKAANKLLETETVSNTKAVSMYAYGALFFLSLVSVLIFYKGDSPSPTMQQGTGDKSYVVDNQGVGSVGNFVGNVGSVGNLRNLLEKKIYISHSGSYKDLETDVFLSRYGALIGHLTTLIQEGHSESLWNHKDLESNIIIASTGKTMGTSKGKWLAGFWAYYKGLRAIWQGNHQSANIIEFDEQGGQRT